MRLPKWFETFQRVDACNRAASQRRAVGRQSRRKIRRRAAGSLHERGAVATAAAMSAMHSTPMLNQLTKNLLEKYRLKFTR